LRSTRHLRRKAILAAQGSSPDMRKRRDRVKDADRAASLLVPGSVNG